jgi:fructokinase
VTPGAQAPAVGIDLGGTKIELQALAADGAVCWRERIPTPPEHRMDATLAAIAGLVARCEAGLGLAPGACTVGIGIPGTVTGDGRVKNANSTYLNGSRFPEALASTLDRPVAVANDANCLALSEANDGAGAGADVVFAVILGTGVGAGLVVHGRVLGGPNGLAGEWGHNPLPWMSAAEVGAAPRCWCGQPGCIEAWLSGPALARDHAATTGVDDPEMDAATIARRAEDGDPKAKATLDRHEERLARALAAVINAVDPDVIVLAGGLSRIARLAEGVPRHWSRHVFGASADEPVRTRLVTARHGDASGVRGAAWLGRGHTRA